MMFYRGYSKVIQDIVLVNALMFIVSMSFGDFVISHLALQPMSVFSRPWTFLTSMFLHANFWHIFFNMFFGVMMFGGNLYELIGKREFLRVYFLGGLAAGLFYVGVSLAFGIPNPRTYAIGASGAVFALIGALVMLRPNQQILLYFLFPMPLYVFAGLYILYSIFAIPLDATGTVAVTAHLGGLLYGLYIGRRYKRGFAEPVYYSVRYY
jgi:uncharacterized protein